MLLSMRMCGCGRGVVVVVGVMIVQNYSLFAQKFVSDITEVVQNTDITATPSV